MPGSKIRLELKYKPTLFARWVLLYAYVLITGVCDECQNYFGREVEKYVLSKTPFAFWRTIYGIKTKKGKEPFYDISQSPNDKRKILDYHDFSDNNIIFHPANHLSENTIEAEITDENLLQDIMSGNKRTVKIVITPKMLIQIGRFLGKMAMEFFYKEFGEAVYKQKFDAIRNYVRYGTTHEIWPILHGTLNKSLLYYQKC